MADPLYFLSAEDRKILQGVISAEKKRLHRPTSLANQDTGVSEQRSLYIAKCPTLGIPGVVGTADPPTPGHANCFIYKLINSRLSKVSGLQRKVYNFSSITATGYVQVAKDKYGVWWVVSKTDSLCFRYLDDVAVTVASALCNPDGTITIVLSVTKTYKYFTGPGTVSTSPCP